MTAEEILAALQEIIANATTDDGEERPLTDDEAARYEELEKQLLNVQKSAQVRSRHTAYTATTPPLTTSRDGDDDPVERAFGEYLRTGNAPAELAQYRAQSAGTNTAGGFIVPAGFRRRLVERMRQFGGIANAAEVFETADGALMNYPTVDDTANIGQIVAEGGGFAAGADLVFANRTLSAYKYFAGGAGTAPLLVSWELLQDSAFDVADFVARKLGERIARLQAVHWATGTGTGQPQGLVTPITATAPTLGATPTYGDLLATMLALDPAYRAGSSWVMNDATYGALLGITDTTGRPLVQDANAGIAGGTGEPRLLGYPVVIDQAMPSRATGAKFLAFGNIREAYVIRRVKDITLVTLTEAYAVTGQTGFMAWARADGAVQNPNAIVVRAGT